MHLGRASLVAAEDHARGWSSTRRPCRRCPGRLRGGKAAHIIARPRRIRRFSSNALLLPALRPGPAVEVAQLLGFERKGHALTRGLFSRDELAAFTPVLKAAVEAQTLAAYRHRVRVLLPGVDPLSITSVASAQAALENALTPVGFLQMLNPHRTCPAIANLAHSPRLASAAAQFLGAPRLRLLQSCVFFKAGGMDSTNWHSDLRMVPLDTNGMVTAWIPLRDMTPDDSGLFFASGSHRDFALAYWHTLAGMDNLEGRGYPIADYGPLALGDASWHHGWTLHQAPPQPTGCLPRVAFTVSFIADGARVLDGRTSRQEVHTEDAESHAAWATGLKPGQRASHPMLPLVWPEATASREAVGPRSRGSEAAPGRHKLAARGNAPKRPG